MSTPAPTEAEPEVDVGPRHFQAVCGVALGVLVLVQFQHDQYLMCFAEVVLGFLGLGVRLPINPLFVVVPVVIGQFQTWAFDRRRFSSTTLFDVEDVVFCVALLMYLAGHFRLHTLWYGVGPAARKKADPAQAIALRELTLFLLTPPLFALAAQGLWAVLPSAGPLPGMPPAWSNFVVVLWVLIVGLYVTAHALRDRRRRRLDGEAARLLMQDVLWHETRGEQRRLERWLAWRSLRKSR